MRKLAKKGVEDDKGYRYKLCGKNNITLIRILPDSPIHSTCHFNISERIFPIESFYYKESHNRTKGNRKHQRSEREHFKISSPFPLRVSIELIKCPLEKLRELISKRKAVALLLDWPLDFLQLCQFPMKIAGF